MANDLPEEVDTCRSWRYIATSEFSSKLDGAKWAVKQQGCPDIVNNAIAARKTGEKTACGPVDDALRYHYGSQLCRTRDRCRMKRPLSMAGCERSKPIQLA